ncbi:hypothetical protein Lal_00029547 [Lupinus albus]|uniref:Putative transcription factor C2H2 family n=1 Tax=Lupinus albus TaxID=3870 RepID=A0A6A5MFY3_LUPAL|nr:putative transcription factor C2H2 family [Lupinus albus]KAF1873841.1 hypothetical protein Lal_00029547 [Lupinus albus]
MRLSIIRDAFDLVTKTQNLSSSKTDEVIDQIGLEIEIALGKMHNTEPGVDCKDVLNELMRNLLRIAPLSQMEGIQNELNVPLCEYKKILEKYFNPDISKAYRNFDIDTHTLNQIISKHFYREGLFDVGDHFVSVLGEPESAAIMKSPFLEMYQMLEAMKDRNLEPALNWAATNSDKLAQSKSDIVLKLHSMQFLKILQNGSIVETIDYGRTYLSPFTSTHKDHIQMLMACLMWIGKLDQSPYKALLLPSNWERLAEELKRQFCNLLGESYNSPLSVTLAAGVQVLPTILKFTNILVKKRQSMNHLPVPIDLGCEFQFHPIFVCPVSKYPATEDNPPMFAACGDVFCKQSILMMTRNGTRVFQCPYCPLDIDAAECRQLHF